MELAKALILLVVTLACVASIMFILAAIVSTPGALAGALVSGRNRSAQARLARRPRLAWTAWITAALIFAGSVVAFQSTASTGDGTKILLTIVGTIAGFLALQVTAFYLAFGLVLRRRDRAAQVDEQKALEAMAIGHTSADEVLSGEVDEDNESGAIAPIIIPGRPGEVEDTTTQEIPVLTSVGTDDEYPPARPAGD